MATDTHRRLQRLFPVPLLVTEVPDSDALNQKIQDEIDTIMRETPNGKPDSWACDVFTTISNNCELHEKPAFREFKGIAMQCLTAFAELMSFPLQTNPIQITECWINVYREGCSQDMHQHANHVMTGVYYMKAPENCAKIQFHSHLADVMIRPPVRRDNDINRMVASYQPRQGDLIIFESNLRHSVPVNEVPGERISISFNALM
jgi:uncharacterized protein (TIGR02466 family)